MSKPGVVVIGAGLGGLRTVENLRRAGHVGPIVLVGAEGHLPYDRPPLTKAVLRGDRDSTVLREDFDNLDVTTMLGRSAVRLAADEHVVELDDGTRLPYTHAVLAPGGQPRRLPGLDGMGGVHVIRTIDDALGLRNVTKTPSTVMVVGGGFIGCEVAASLRMSGTEIDLIEVAQYPLARVLGNEAGSIVADILTARGVRLHCGIGVEEVLGTDHVSGVRLSDGSTIAGDEVVLGLGIVPSVDWLEGSGVVVDDGIVCDRSGRTSVPDVFALGDAASWPHPLLKARRRVEHWTTTGEQAVVVAEAIANGAEPPPAQVPYFWSDVFDVKIQALGFVDPSDDVHTLDINGRTLLLYSRLGVVRAAVGFSAPRAVMRLRGSIAAGATVDEAERLCKG